MSISGVGRSGTPSLPDDDEHQADAAAARPAPPRAAARPAPISDDRIRAAIEAMKAPPRYAVPPSAAELQGEATRRLVPPGLETSFADTLHALRDGRFLVAERSGKWRDLTPALNPGAVRPEPPMPAGKARRLDKATMAEAYRVFTAKAGKPAAEPPAEVLARSSKALLTPPGLEVLGACPTVYRLPNDRVLVRDLRGNWFDVTGPK